MTYEQMSAIAGRLLVRNRVGKAARRLARSARIALRPDHVMFRGSILPVRERRSCGPEFRDDELFLRSSEQEARRLVERLDCTITSRVLDVGCGQGRLPIGLIRVLGEIDYLGVDVHKASIRWCRRHIQSHYPSFRFHQIDVANDRYNARGRALTDAFRFDLPASSVDIIYAYAVFSNLMERDMWIYLRDFWRILTDRGRIFFTTFAEENVPSFAVNPAGYVFDRLSGPLHVVRYEISHLFSIMLDLGYVIEEFAHGAELRGQSGIILRKAATGGRARAAAGGGQKFTPVES